MDIAPTLRIAFAAVMVIAQVITCWLGVLFLASYAVPVYALLELAAGIATVALMSGNRDANYRYAWVVLVLVLGVFGLLLYLLWGHNGGHRGSRNALSRRMAETGSAPLSGLALPEAAQARAALAADAPQATRTVDYLAGQGFPLYQQTGTAFYPLGEWAFEAMLADMERAERFIYLEFFMVFEGQIWSSILDVLTRKAEQGVDVRLIYDDMGSITTTSHSFLRGLRRAGIRVQVFNPVHRYIYQLYLNYRDHRKILAVDGHIAYTGGINLGDEYANLYKKHGHWKDTAVRLEGPAAHSLTECFLRMWHAIADTPCEPVPAPAAPLPDTPGYVIPYVDGPDSNPENPSEMVYLELISTARESLYMTSPYLILNDHMLSAICLAARSGVDTRIVVPAIPDHWYVHLTSQSFFGELLRSGVRVYEYTPGFIHAKMMVADGLQAVVGSINLDYRSFYLQHESAAWFCGGPVPEAVHADIGQVFAVSREVSLEEWDKRPWYIKTLQPVLRIFAPLM